MTSAVSTEQRDGVLVITMDDGKVNALTLDLSSELSEALSRAEAEPAIHAAVLAGRPGRFSAGFDLSLIQSGDRAAIASMVHGGGRLVRQIYGLGVPVVGACTGHAIAAGALVLLGCDVRIGADIEVKVGLNEVAIGATLPGWAHAIAAARLSRRHHQRAVLNAVLYDPRGAVDAGFLDAVVLGDDVISAATEAAASMSNLDPAAYRSTVKAVRGATLEEMQADLER